MELTKTSSVSESQSSLHLPALGWFARQRLSHLMLRYGPCTDTSTSQGRLADVHAPMRQGWLHCILYVLFENAMGVVKLGAVVAGARASRPTKHA